MAVGGFCGKCCSTPNVRIHTFWCGTGACVAPGTIAVKVTLQGPLDPITGDPTCPETTVVAAGTADAAGTFECTLPAGVYCASASTTAAGYLNVPVPFTVPGPTPWTDVVSAIYPDQLTVSDATTGGSATVYPYGTVPPAIDPGGAQADGGFYAAQTPYAYRFGGDADCPSADVDIYYYFTCGDTGSAGKPYIGGAMVQSSSSGDPTTCCPGGTPGGYYCTTPAGVKCIVAGNGPGPASSPPCFPMAETGPAPAEVTSTIGAAGKIYSSTSAFTVSQ